MWGVAHQASGIRSICSGSGTAGSDSRDSSGSSRHGSDDDAGGGSIRNSRSSSTSKSTRSNSGSGSSGNTGGASNANSSSSRSSASSRGSAKRSQSRAVSGRQGWAAKDEQPSRKQSRHVDYWRGNTSIQPTCSLQGAQLTSRITATKTPEQLLALLQQHSVDMNAINLGSAFTHARKLCRTGVLPEQQPAAVQQLLRHLHQLAERLQQQCDARQLANMILACGHLRMTNTAELLLPEFRQGSKLQQANPQHVSNVLWAIAVLDMHPVEMGVLQLVQRMQQLLPQANPQDISNAMWAVATLGVQLAGEVAQQLVQRFMQVLAEANPQNVSSTLGACAAMGMQLTGDQVQQLVQHLIKVLPQANTQAIANSLGAVARMGHTLPADQLEQLLAHTQQQLPNTISQHVAETLWACGRMHYAPLQLLSALEQQPQLLTALLAAAGPQDLANMAWACGELGYRGKLLPEVLQQLMLLLQHSTTRSYTMQNLCNSCWSASVLDLQECVPQVLQLASTCPQLWATAVDVELHQLYQVHLWLLDSRLPAPGQGLLGVLSQQQLQQCKDSWEQSLTESTSSAKASDLHRSVFAALQALPADTWQQPPVLEQRTADGALSIDIAATTRSGVQLAIEVDGPSHFVQPDGMLTGPTLSGPTLFRNMALAARGHVLVSIPYRAWDRLHGAAAKQQQYLDSTLQEAEQAAASAPAQQP